LAKGFAARLVGVAAKPFLFFANSRRDSMTSPTTAASHSPAAQPADQPAIIATRQHCEAEGVGLSHYILMDRVASPVANLAELPAEAAAAAPAATA
jgi:modified peptide precursor CbpA